MLYHGRSKVPELPTQGKSKAPKATTNVEESFRAAQWQPLYEVRRNLPTVIIKGLEQPLGSLSIRKEGLGNFWPFPRSQNIRERSPKIPGIMLCQEKRALAGAKVTTSKERILISPCPLLEQPHRRKRV
jgi:hypothetical protein